MTRRAVTAIEHEDALGAADLIGRQTYTDVDGMHRVEELVDELLDRFVEADDRSRLLPENRVPVKGYGLTGVAAGVPGHRGNLTADMSRRLHFGR